MILKIKFSRNTFK